MNHGGAWRPTRKTNYTNENVKYCLFRGEPWWCMNSNSENKHILGHEMRTSSVESAWQRPHGRPSSPGECFDGCNEDDRKETPRLRPRPLQRLLDLEGEEVPPRTRVSPRPHRGTRLGGPETGVGLSNASAGPPKRCQPRPRGHNKDAR